MTKSQKPADKSIKNTGERMVPAHHKGKLVYGEHIVRYEALKDLVKDKVVLDLASGSGFGTNIISKAAKTVFGIDNNAEAISYSKSNYSSSNTKFIQGDATAIPLEDASVDVAVSFETLEHVEEYEKFISELKRVLKPEGLLVLSTPNDIEFPEGADFHVHEFTNQELQKLVIKYFKNIKPYFQATWIYNALLDEKNLTNESTILASTFNLAPIDLRKALYFYFLCSNRPINEVVEPTGGLSEHWSDRKMLEKNKEMDKYIRKTIKHYEDIISEKDSRQLKLLEENESLREELTLVKKSKTWKAAQKLRALRNKVQKK